MDKMKKGTLFLIPTTLGDNMTSVVLPPANTGIIRRIKHYIVEELRTARRFLKAVAPDVNIDSLQFNVLNEHTSESEALTFLGPLLAGEDTAILSEAGTPCVADPGSVIVRLAHQNNIRVVPLVGPSSIILALMASGFNGQRFVFHGYLPVDKDARAKKLKDMEKDIAGKDQTQIFIETPYRNLQLLNAIIGVCNPSDLLCIAVSLTTSEEKIITLPLKEWKKITPDIHKKPAVFLLYNK